MEIISGSQNILTPFSYPIVTIGNFDGIHRGHQSIFRRVVQKAREKNGTSVVLTFNPHPVKVLAPEKSPRLLTSFKQKMRLIADCGIDCVVCEEFDHRLARMPAADFARTLLADRLRAREIMVGSGFVFGRGREGAIADLAKFGEQLGFAVHIVDPVKAGGEIVSSSRIRTLLSAGEVEQAAELLGRPYSLSGPVVEGRRAGKNLGIPTANVRPDEDLSPPRGVYAVRVFLDGEEHSGVVNVGFNPTFNGKRLSVEVHLFDFNRQIYGREIDVRFIRRIRGEVAFSSTDALVRQIEQDIQTAKTLLTEHSSR
ncbi:MAG: bifunctional riboflavin kinase/FAD synthetase [Nitrospinales bacterium]